MQDYWKRSESCLPPSGAGCWLWKYFRNKVAPDSVSCLHQIKEGVLPLPTTLHPRLAAAHSSHMHLWTRWGCLCPLDLYLHKELGKAVPLHRDLWRVPVAILIPLWIRSTGSPVTQGQKLSWQIPHSAWTTTAHTYVSSLVNCRARITSPPRLAPKAVLSSTGSYVVGRAWRRVLELVTPCKSTQSSCQPFTPTYLATAPAPPRLGILWGSVGGNYPLTSYFSSDST